MRESIIVTGASGYLGNELIKLLYNKKFYIVAATSDSQKLYLQFPNRDALKCITRQELLADGNHWDHVYAVIHLAFARRFCPNSEIADSVLYSRKVFEQVKKHKVPRVINVSSQSVYGNAEEVRTENTRVSPEMIYAMAKYAVEVILDGIFQNCDSIVTTNIRLDSIAQNQNLLPRLVEQAFKCREINLVGGKQIFSLLDIRDGAAALVKLLDTDSNIWAKIYNVGWNNKVHTLIEIGELVARIAEEHGAGKVRVNLTEEDIRTYGGMDSSLFTTDTGWQPQYGIEAIIEKSVEEYLFKIRG